MTVTKTALYGGAFDPVHIGHIEVAKQVNNRFNFDKFVFIPSNLPPHKQKHAVSPQHRYKMLEIVANELGSSYFVDDIEITNSNVSYTIDTLKKYKSLHQNEELYFVCGSDIFATLKQWNEWEQLFKYAKFVVVSRTDMPFDKMFEELGEDIKSKTCLDNTENCMNMDNEIILFEVFLPDASSSYIKNNDILNTSLVTTTVLDYINEHKLYKG